MFVKIVTIVLLAFIAVSKGATEWDGLVASWRRGTPTYSYDLPRTLSAAVEEGWSFISGVEQSKEITPLGYQGDPRFVLLFCQDKVVGYQVGFPVADVADKGQPMDWGNHDNIITKELNGVLYYTGTAWFIHDEKRGIRKLWLQEKSGLVEVPTNASRLAAETPFMLKLCYETMGTHYYAWKSDADCTALSPWFLMSEGDLVIGAGFQGMGTPSYADSRKWWETVTSADMLYVFPDAPQCAVEATDKFGALSVHVWFVANPQNIRCD